MPYFGIPTETSTPGNVGVPVFVQDQTTDSLDIRFLRQLSTTTTDAATTIEGYTVAVPSGHGIVAGNVVEIQDNANFVQARVLTAASTSITLDTPIGRVYPSGSFVKVSTSDMRVNGSVTPVIFTVAPNIFQAGDISRVIISIQSSNSMDFSDFGSKSALTRGCVLRAKKSDGTFRTLFNWKTNGSFIEHSFDYTFEDKAGGGLYGFVAKYTSAGPENQGVAIRLDGALYEELQVVVQDDISTGLSLFKMLAQGHELQ
jgi:hypothetical protein